MAAVPEPAEPMTEAQRRRLAEVFGDVLPDITTDERDPAAPEDPDAALLADRPPHHDRDA